MRSSRRPLLVLSLLGLAFVVPALAQPASPSAYPQACEDAKVTKADRDRAHTVYLSGKQFLDESNYDKAISYFKDAYSIDCSVHGILLAIATANERKGDKREAIHALEEYQKRAPSAADHEVVDRRIKNLKDQLPLEPPTAPSATASAPSAPAPAASGSVEPSATAGSTGPLPTTPAPQAPPEGGSYHTAGPWIAVGAGVAALAGGVIMYAVGAPKISDAENVCPTRMNCAATVAGEGNDGRSLETAGITVGSVGLAAVVAGLVWHFTEHPKTASTALAPGVRIEPMLAPGVAGISLGTSLQ